MQLRATFEARESRRKFLTAVGVIAVAAAILLTVNIPSSLAGGEPIEVIEGPIQSLEELPLSGCQVFPLLEEGSEFLKRRETPAALGWTTSGVWSGDQLYLADLTFRRIAKMNVGGYLGPLEKGHAGLRAEAPWYLHPRQDGGFLVLDLQDSEVSRILSINAHGELEQEMQTQGRILTDEKLGEIKVTGVYRMVPAKNGVVTYADFLAMDPDPESEREWSSFIYLEFESDAYHPIGEPRKSNEEFSEFYVRDFNLLTEVAGETYVLMMERPQPWIGRVDIDNRSIVPLASTPALELPKLDAKPEQFEAQHEFFDWLYGFYRNVEDSAMAAGLVSFEDRLFILNKGAASEANGAVSWSLVEVSPEDGRELGNRLELPTRSEHVAIVPGSRFAVIEKGPITLLDSFPRMALYRPTLTTVLFSELALDQGRFRFKNGCTRIKVAANN